MEQLMTLLQSVTKRPVGKPDAPQLPGAEESESFRLSLDEAILLPSKQQKSKDADTPDSPEETPLTESDADQTPGLLKSTPSATENPVANLKTKTLLAGHTLSRRSVEAGDVETIRAIRSVQDIVHVAREKELNLTRLSVEVRDPENGTKRLNITREAPQEASAPSSDAKEIARHSALPRNATDMQETAAPVKQTAMENGSKQLSLEDLIKTPNKTVKPADEAETGQAMNKAQPASTTQKQLPEADSQTTEETEATAKTATAKETPNPKEAKSSPESVSIRAADHAETESPEPIKYESRSETKETASDGKKQVEPNPAVDEAETPVRSTAKTAAEPLKSTENVPSADIRTEDAADTEKPSPLKSRDGERAPVESRQAITTTPATVDEQSAEIPKQTLLEDESPETADAEAEQPVKKEEKPKAVVIPKEGSSDKQPVSADQPSRRETLRADLSSLLKQPTAPATSETAISPADTDVRKTPDMPVSAVSAKAPKTAKADTVSDEAPAATARHTKAADLPKETRTAQPAPSASQSKPAVSADPIGNLNTPATDLPDTPVVKKNDPAPALDIPESEIPVLRRDTLSMATTEEGTAAVKEPRQAVNLGSLLSGQSNRTERTNTTVSAKRNTADTAAVKESKPMSASAASVMEPLSQTESLNRELMGRMVSQNLSSLAAASIQGSMDAAPSLNMETAAETLDPALGEQAETSMTQNSEESASQADIQSADDIRQADTLKNRIQSARATIAHFTHSLKEQIENYKAPLMKLEMALNPKNLGNVSVTLLNRGKNLHVQINSNSQAVALLMQNNVDFKNALGDLGYRDVQLNFTSGNSGGGSSGSASQQQQQQQTYYELSENNTNQTGDETIEIVLPDLIYG